MSRAVKVGDEYFQCSVDEQGKVEFAIHRVRTIRAGKIFATEVNIATWGKVSKKHGDFGWLPNIWPWFRNSWPIGGNPPRYLKTTKLAAIRAELAHHKAHSVPDDYAVPEMCAAITKKLSALEKANMRKKP